MTHKKLLIIGGGAAGYFLAANLGDGYKNQVLILEKAQEPLQKVKISGGGRCNVTHSCFTVEDLIKNYPRGGKALRSVFYQFQPSDTIKWFEERGVALKTEKDGRIFPTSNSSQSIIYALRKEAEKTAEPIFGCTVLNIQKKDDLFFVDTTEKQYSCDFLVLATGSNRNIWQKLENLGFKIVEAVPSLFSFNIPDKNLNELMGTSFEKVEVELPEAKLKSEGALLITHWGISGPAVLKLSAFGAIKLAEMDYKTEVKINWINQSEETCYQDLIDCKNQFPNQSLDNKRPYNLSKRFWTYVLAKTKIQASRWQELSKKEIRSLAQILTKSTYPTDGKSTNKEEFVTAGGLNLKEVDFSTMQSKKIENLFVVGEALDVDAVTGGFNFQACWSEAYVLANFLNEKLG